jgi:hypothetical protein
VNPTLSLLVAWQRVADLLRSADPGRRLEYSEDKRPESVGSSYRLADGSWIYGRRDSS